MYCSKLAKLAGINHVAEISKKALISSSDPFKDNLFNKIYMRMKNYKLINNISGWTVFLIAAFEAWSRSETDERVERLKKQGREIKAIATRALQPPELPSSQPLLYNASGSINDALERIRGMLKEMAPRP